MAGIVPRESSSRAHLAALVRIHGDAGDLSRVRRLHSRIRDDLLLSNLVQAYGKCRSVHESRRCFDAIRNKTVVSWTSMIAAYARNGHCGEALQLYTEMLLLGVRPDRVAFVELLSVCAKARDLKIGAWIHLHIIESGVQCDLVLQTAIASMYGKCGDVASARVAFEEIEQPNCCSWNALIAAYAHNGHCWEALEAFRGMDQSPDRHTFVSVLGACSSLEELLEIHAKVVSSGLELDLMVVTQLITMYGKLGRIGEARFLLDKAGDANVVVWNSMLSAYAQTGHSKKVLELYCFLDQAGLRADETTFVIVLNAVGALGAVKEVVKIHARVNSQRIESSIVNIALVFAYGKCRRLDSSKEVFLHKKVAEVTFYNAMIKTYIVNEMDREALQLLKYMDLEGIKPNSVSFISLLGSCSSLDDLEEGTKQYKRIVSSSLEQDLVVKTALISFYGKCGDLAQARSLLDSAQTKDVVSWNAMITSYARHGRYEAALELFETMLSSVMKPTTASFTAALGACLDSGALATGRRIHECASASKEELDLTVRNALVGMYGKCGSIEDASRIFSETEEKSLLSWNTMLAAYSQNDRGRRNALDLLNKMLLEGFQPNGATFVSVLSACSHSGRFAEGCAQFIAMQNDHGVAADAEHYGCMVDLFGRLGRLTEAENTANYAPKGGDCVCG